MKGSSIILNHVSAKQQGVEVLNDISFCLQAGDHLAVTGPSGSGKTTLARVIAGQLYAEGKLEIAWDESSLLQREVVLVEQSNPFKTLSRTSDFYYQQRFNSFDAGDSETVWQALINSGGQPDEGIITSWLQQFGLTGRRNAALIQLSSGENKRFQLIKAISSRPQVLILDSPFTGLDAAARKHLNRILDDLALHGTRILIITGICQIPDCITHIALLQKGELKSFGPKEYRTEEIMTLHTKQASIDVTALPVSELNVDYNNFINMRNVSVQYEGKVVLNNINWQVKHGEKWLLKGQNGAGKSTLLSLINGDNPQAYKNEIYLFDKHRGTGESIWDIKNKISYVSPELHAFFDKSVSCFNAIASGFFDTIGLFKKLSGQQQQQVQLWIDAFGLQSVQHKALSLTSFSTQRMILLARALVKNPLLLILDEPCQGLDDEQRESFVSLINDVSEYFNKTLIYVSHYEDEIPLCIQHTLTLNKGEQKIYSSKKEAAIL